MVRSIHKDIHCTKSRGFSPGASVLIAVTLAFSMPKGGAASITTCTQSWPVNSQQWCECLFNAGIDFDNMTSLCATVTNCGGIGSCGCASCTSGLVLNPSDPVCPGCVSSTPSCSCKCDDPANTNECRRSNTACTCSGGYPNYSGCPIQTGAACTIVNCGTCSSSGSCVGCASDTCCNGTTCQLESSYKATLGTCSDTSGDCSWGKCSCT